MRKFLFVTLLLASAFFVSCTHRIERLDAEEIKANETPRAVAYNFVLSIVNEDYATAVDLMSTNYFFKLMPELFGGIPISQLFSNQFMHDIVDMRPVVKMGYEVVITDVQEFPLDKCFAEDSTFRNVPAYIVKFDCADANDKFYDDSNGEYDTDATIFVVKEDDEWKIFEIK